MIAVSAGIVALGYVVSVQTLNLAQNVEQYQDNIINKLKAVKPEGGLYSKLSKFGDKVQTDLAAPSTTQATTQTTDLLATAVKPEPKPLVRDDSPDASMEAKDAVSKDYTKSNPLPVAVVQTGSSPLGQLGAYLGLALSPLGTAGIVAVFLIFMLLEREDLRDRMVRLVGFGQLNITTKAVDDATTRISRYLFAQAIVNGTYGIAITLGLWALGAIFGDQIFPSAVLWGLLCAILRFIPYVGPWLAAAFPLIVAFAVYPGFGVFTAVVVLFVVIELLSNNFMEPWLYGSSTGMSAVAVIVSAVFWTWLWGPVGLVLATPMTVCIVVLGKYVPNLRFFDILLGDDPVFAPPERIYQRLLAGDAEEAADIAHEYLQKMSLEQVYDTVLMPALALSEQDRHRGQIDEERAKFILLSMRELVDELGDSNRVKIARGMDDADRPTITGSVRSTLSATLASTATLATTALSPVARLTLPKDCIVNVLIMPAHDDADEVVGLMIAQLLNRRGYCAVPMSVNTLAGEMVEQVEKTKADVVCVSALPPGAVMHSRYLCKRLHQKLPNMPTVVGLWSFKGDVEKAAARIACVASVSVEPTIVKALDEIDQRAHSVIFAADAELKRKAGDTPASSV